MLEKYLIAHCAPTLASLKTASLFCMSVLSEQDLEGQIKDWNSRLWEKGLFLMVLKRYKDKALVYVCRKSHLQADLKKAGVANFLAQYGYRHTDLKYALSRLRQRLNSSNSFPHEIGIF